MQQVCSLFCVVVIIFLVATLVVVVVVVVVVATNRQIRLKKKDGERSFVRIIESHHPERISKNLTVAQVSRFDKYTL